MKSFLALCVARFEEAERDLNALDAATGDGDHGATVLKGLRAAATVDDSPEKAFRKAAGGASGSLFSQVIGALRKAEEGAALSASLSEAADKIMKLGQAEAGDKTMLDALIPAAGGETAASAAALAEKGRDSTLAMAARRGRARYVEGAGVGHVDPGAASVALLLALYADWRNT